MPSQVASKTEVLAFFSRVMRLQADGASLKEALKAAELLAKHYALFRDTDPLPAKIMLDFGGDSV